MLSVATMCFAKPAEPSSSVATFSVVNQTRASLPWIQMEQTRGTWDEPNNPMPAEDTSIWKSTSNDLMYYLRIEGRNKCEFSFQYNGYYKPGRMYVFNRNNVHACGPGYCCTGSDGKDFYAKASDGHVTVYPYSSSHS